MSYLSRITAAVSNVEVQVRDRAANSLDGGVEDSVNDFASPNFPSPKRVTYSQSEIVSYHSMSQPGPYSPVGDGGAVSREHEQGASAIPRSTFHASQRSGVRPLSAHVQRNQPQSPSNSGNPENQGRPRMRPVSAGPIRGSENKQYGPLETEGRHTAAWKKPTEMHGGNRRRHNRPQSAVSRSSQRSGRSAGASLRELMSTMQPEKVPISSTQISAQTAQHKGRMIQKETQQAMEQGNVAYEPVLRKDMRKAHFLQTLIDNSRHQRQALQPYIEARQAEISTVIGGTLVNVAEQPAVTGSSHLPSQSITSQPLTNAMGMDQSSGFEEHHQMEMSGWDDSMSNEPTTAIGVRMPDVAEHLLWTKEQEQNNTSADMPSPRSLEVSNTYANTNTNSNSNITHSSVEKNGSWSDANVPEPEGEKEERKKEKPTSPSAHKVRRRRPQSASATSNAGGSSSQLLLEQLPKPRIQMAGIRPLEKQRKPPLSFSLEGKRASVFSKPRPMSAVAARGFGQRPSSYVPPGPEASLAYLSDVSVEFGVIGQTTQPNRTAWNGNRKGVKSKQQGRRPQSASVHGSASSLNASYASPSNTRITQLIQYNQSFGGSPSRKAATALTRPTSAPITRTDTAHNQRAIDWAYLEPRGRQVSLQTRT